MRLLKHTLFIGLVILSFSCKKNKGGTPAPTEVEKATQLLTGESVTTTTVADFWTVSSVIVDDLDYTFVFEGFTIQFSNNTFSTTNGKIVFDASGSWNFADETAQKIVLSNGVELTLLELTETQLKFEFFWDETIYGGGRTNSVGGLNTFTLNR